jgi:acyl-CoA reductase-like NAD-dependent aldehyde dehydrogenase
MSDFQLTINGKGVDAERYFEVINPATETLVARAPDAGRTQLEATVVAANAAFVSWGQSARSERNSHVQQLMGLLQENLESLAQLLTQEQGKPLQDARDEVGACLMWCEAFVHTRLTNKILQDTPENRIELQHRPLGVVAAIVPWNAPLMVAVWKLLQAVLSGNTIIIKPSPYTPLTALKLGEFCRQAFPPGVVNVLSGGNEVGQWMTSHEGIHKVSFTGSTNTGKQIMASASGNLKRLTLELGGNDAAIVLNDVDVAAVTEKLFWSAFYNAGQICAALKRLYVHEDIYEALCQALVSYAGYIKQGNGLEEGVAMGPVQNRMQFEKLCELSRSVQEEGGRFLCGGVVTAQQGYFFPITLVADLADDSRLVSEEQFGPILPILRFSDVDDVIERANNTPYGLGGSIWTNNLELGAELANRLESGSAWVNQHAAVRPDVPFGGAKQSGIGVENTELGLAEFTRVQVINVASPAAVSAN